MATSITEIPTIADSLSATAITLGTIDCSKAASLEVALVLGKQGSTAPAGAPATLVVNFGVLDPISNTVIPLDATANGAAGTTSIASPGTTVGLLAGSIKKFTNLPPIVTITATIATNYTAGTATIGVLAWLN